MLSSINEGGALRAGFVAVALIAFMDHNCVDFDTDVAVSASVATLAYFAAGQRKEMTRLWRDKLSTPKFVHYRNILAASLMLSPKRPILDIDYHMSKEEYLQPLAHCTICEHRCGVNRLEGQTGICRMTMPVVASATLHPAPPESYTIFMAGCNYKCLNCQNWTIAQLPDNGYQPWGFVSAKELAMECVTQLNSPASKLMGADRIFFSGGEPTIHLPYIEEVIVEARKLSPGLKVNFDTNGYLTSASLDKVLKITTSITYDIKALNDEVHLALTGASSQPVLRNAKYIGRFAKDKLWEFRILVIPKINEEEIEPLCCFISDIDADLPVCFLAFRPNYVLEHHPGAAAELMDRCVSIAKNNGLKNAYWTGQTRISGAISAPPKKVVSAYQMAGGRLAGAYAHAAGCQTHVRNCANCSSHQTCPVKRYIPKIQT